MLTFPYFLSWVILAGLFLNLLGFTGVVNNTFAALGLPKQNFLMNPCTFRGLLVATNIWKEAGWGSIIYLAAITEEYDITRVFNDGIRAATVVLTAAPIAALYPFLQKYFVRGLTTGALKF